MKKIKKRTWFILLGLVIALSFCKQVENQHNLKLAHSLNESHPVHLGIVEMARLLEEISDGKMSIDIYANGQLGQERELLELLQIGSLDMTKVSAGALENFIPDFKVLTLPYLFKDSTHTWSVLQGPIGKRLLAKGSQYYLRGLCFYDAGSRSFYAKEKPINSPKDLYGLKVRVMNSQSAFSMINALGGAPTPVSWGELYTALQQGVVDAAENNLPSFFNSRHYVICKYYSFDQHTSIPDVLMVSTYLWNSLNEQEQQWLQEAANRSVEYQKQVWALSVQQCLVKVKKAGVTIFYPEKKPFQMAVSSLYNTYQEETELHQLIDEIKNIVK